MICDLAGMLYIHMNKMTNKLDRLMLPKQHVCKQQKEETNLPKGM
jgi:hypothetical protein